LTRTNQRLADVRLLCFPHAGGAASTYREWAMTSALDIWAVQLPGREDRLREPAETTVEAMANSVVHRLTAAGISHRVALFGHSFGALVAYETTRQLETLRRAPLALLVSAARPPDTRPRGPALSELSTSELVEWMLEVNGTDPRLAVADVIELAIPALRADLVAAERYVRDDPPLTVPICVYGASDDPFTPLSDLDAWRRRTSLSYRSRHYTGGHFYFRKNLTAFLSDVTSDLMARIPSQAST
jgi:surfactin synthase thioesterase subunit